MALESLYADGIEAGIQRDLASPRPQEPASFRMGAFLAAGVEGLPAAALEVAGSIRDLSSGVDQRYAAERSARARRLGEPEPNTYVMPTGADERRRAQEFAPDPMTAHTADQVLFGLTRIGAKVGAASLTGNLPAAGGLLFAEGANTSFQSNTAKGIDEATALKLAAVEGTGQAAALIPLAGPGIKSTLALMAGAGPGTFMAQETLSKKILEQAGYHDEASRHDPLDPLGLSLSIALPAIVGGAHIVGLSRPRPAPIGPIKTETDVKAAVQLTPAEQQISDAFERSAENLRELSAAVAAEKNPANKAILQAELQKQQAAATSSLESHVIGRGAVDPAVVDAARVQVTNEALHRSMPDDLDAVPEVMRAGDAIAAGEFPTVRPMPEKVRTPSFDDEHIATLQPEAQQTMREMYASAAREKPGFDRTLQGISDEIGGRLQTAPLKGTERATAKAVSDYGGDPSKLKDLLRATIEVNSADAAQRAVASVFERFDVLPGGRRNNLDPAKQPADGYRDAKFNVSVNGHVAEVQVNVPAMLKAKEKAHALYEERSKLERELRDKPLTSIDQSKLDRIGELNGKMREIYDAAWAEATSARNSASEISAPLRRADSGSNSRGGDASQASEYPSPVPAPRETGMPSTSKNTAVGENLAGKASEAADSRFMGTSDPILKQTEGKREPPPFDPGRAERLVEQSPDLQVKLPGSEQTLTVAEAMKLAREEHAFDLGENDLLKAAFECALSFGG